MIERAAGKVRGFVDVGSLEVRLRAARVSSVVEHLQLPSEVLQRNLLIDNLSNSGIVVEGLRAQQEAQHFHLLQHSLDVTELPVTARLIALVTKRLDLDLPVEMFVTPGAEFSAATFPIANGGRNSRGVSAVVVVTSHFFEELDDAQQAAVLGHELGHILFGHNDIPTGALLDIDDVDLQRLAPLVASYSTTCEVSCDLVSMLASKGWKPPASALIKAQSGFGTSFLDRNGGLESLLELTDTQFDRIVQSPLEAGLGTHPLFPARLRMLREASSSPLFKSKANSLSTSELLDARSALSDCFVETVGAVCRFPGIQESDPRHEEILVRLAFGIAVADGVIDDAEWKLLSQIAGPAAIGEIADRFKSTPALLKEINRLASRAKLEPNEAARLLRSALSVSLSAGRIAAPALDFALAFARGYGFDSDQVLYLAEQAARMVAVSAYHS